MSFDRTPEEHLHGDRRRGEQVGRCSVHGRVVVQRFVEHPAVPPLGRPVRTSVVGGDGRRGHADRRVHEGDHHPGAVLAVRAVHEHRAATDVIGDQVEHVGDLRLAARDDLLVHRGHVGRFGERRRVVEIDHTVDERSVERALGSDEAGSADDLGVLAEVDHRLEAERRDRCTAGFGDADRVVASQQQALAHAPAVAGGPPAGVAEVDAPVDAEVAVGRGCHGDPTVARGSRRYTRRAVPASTAARSARER